MRDLFTVSDLVRKQVSVCVYFPELEKPIVRIVKNRPTWKCRFFIQKWHGMFIFSHTLYYSKKSLHR